MSATAPGPAPLPSAAPPAPLTRRMLQLLPGLLLALAVVLAATAASEALDPLFGRPGIVSPIMMAIVFGIAARNLLGMPDACHSGLQFCLKRLLRLGIILMGFRLSLVDAGRIGVWGLPIIALCIVTGLAVAGRMARALALPARLGTLLAVGTSICGATAIVATAPVIGAKDEEVAYAVANVTVFGIAAMLLYPYAAHALFGESALLAGLFQGTAIHETAQVAGAALIYDAAFGGGATPGAADIAIVTKLVRNVAIAVVVPLMAVAAARHGACGNARASGWRLFPVFILGFMAMAALRSLGDAGLAAGGRALGAWSATDWKALGTLLQTIAVWALALAMAGVGLGTRLASFRGLGIKPFYVGFVAAGAVSAVSIVAVSLLGRFVAF